MTTKTAARHIPEWLEPIKNTWQSASKMNQIFRLEGGCFSAWFSLIKPRLRSVIVPYAKGSATKYLVKQVWAAALAHGVKLKPSDEQVPADALNREINKLRLELEAQKNVICRVIEVNHTNESIDLLRLLAAATDARPVPGVYWLLDNVGEVAYVGQSKNVLARMSGHVGKEFATVRMVQITDDKRRLYIESRLIRLLTPPKNIVGIGFKRELEQAAVSDGGQVLPTLRRWGA